MSLDMHQPPFCFPDPTPTTPTSAFHVASAVRRHLTYVSGCQLPLVTLGGPLRASTSVAYPNRWGANWQHAWEERAAAYMRFGQPALPAHVAMPELAALYLCRRERGLREPAQGARVARQEIRGGDTGR